MMEPTPPSAKARWAARTARTAHVPSSPSTHQHAHRQHAHRRSAADTPSLGSVAPIAGPSGFADAHAVPRRHPQVEPLFLPNDEDDEMYDHRAIPDHRQERMGEDGRDRKGKGRAVQLFPVGMTKRRKRFANTDAVESLPDNAPRLAEGQEGGQGIPPAQGPSSTPPLPRTPSSPDAIRPKAKPQMQPTMGTLLQDEDEVFVPVGNQLDPSQPGAEVLGGSAREIAGGDGEAEAVTPEWDTQTILAVHCPAGYNVAAAVFSPEDQKVYVVEDTKDTTGYDLIALIVEQTQPKTIIMSARVQDELFARVKEYCDTSADGAKISLQVHASFSDRQTLSALSQVRLPDMDLVSGPASHDQQDYEEDGNRGGLDKLRLALLKLGCRVNMELPAVRGAAGGLLVYMQKQKVLAANFDGEPGIQLEGIASLALHKHMIINQDALTSLAIFDIEGHAFSNNSRNKQAKSIFRLLDSCVTTAGKRLFHTWHLRPLLSLEEIAERHDAVELFTAADNSHGAKIMRKHMYGIKNVCRVMKLLRKGDGKVKDWKTLTDALMAFMLVRDQISGVSRTKPIPVIDKVISSIDGSLPALAHLIMNTIDWDSSQDHDRVCIRRGIDQNLDRKKEDLAELESHLDAISRRIAETVDARFYENLKVQYLPQLGFLTAISPAMPNVPAPMGWEAIFSTDDTQYYKNPKMRNMDEHFGDIETDIQDIEIEIVQELVEQLRKVVTAVTIANDAIAELDCIISLSEAAIDLQLVRPRMVEEPILKIKDGRHLLQELSTEIYIPNDTAIMGGDARRFSNMMIVTGANGSGKSVYGKQVALIAFMAQIGSFVPAASAEIGLVDRIFTRLQTKESAARTGSAFMIDLSQVAVALRGATERSLLILDEFGKGTNSVDGAGLLAGVIEHLQRERFPRSIVLTHFHELFAQQIIPPDLDSVLFCHMRSIMQQDAKHLTYSYKIEPGMSYSSNAAECAAMHGIPADIIERARFVTECVATSNIAKVYEQELTQDEYDELREAEQLAYRFLKWDIDDKYDVKLQLEDMLDQYDAEMIRMRKVDNANSTSKSKIETGTEDAVTDYRMSEQERYPPPEQERGRWWREGEEGVLLDEMDGDSFGDAN